MKIPGIKNIAKGLKHIFQKFPVESLFTVISTLLALASVNSYDRAYHFPKWILEDGLMTLHISILFYLGINLLIKYTQEPSKKASPFLYLFVLIPILLFFYLRDIEANSTVVWIRYAILNFSGHLWVASVAFLLNRGQLEFFWTYNKRLFLRILTSFFYSLVLFLGISLAFLALEYLFGIEVEPTFYYSLGIWTGLLFNTFYFLGGIPVNKTELLEEEKKDYPKSLKYFTQYVLIPLIALYLIILISYEIKILILWTLPKGWVSEMIIAYAVFSIFSILLVHPIKNNPGNKWINTFSRIYSISLIPLCLLFFLALYRRISDYGITEQRYILIFLAFWLFGISLFMIFKKNYPIRFIPISLWIWALVCLLNPWNLFVVSEKSQFSRFEKSLKTPDTLISPENPPSQEYDIRTNKPISNYYLKQELFDYLFRRYSYQPFQKLVKINLDSLKVHFAIRYEKNNLRLHDKVEYYYWSDSVRLYLEDYFKINQPSNSPKEKVNPFHTINLTNTENKKFLKVIGWDYYATTSLNMEDEDRFTQTDTLMLESNNTPVVISQFKPYQTLVAKFGKDIITLNLKPQIQYLNTLPPPHTENDNFTLDLRDLSLAKNSFYAEGENQQYKIRIQILNGEGEFNKEALKMKSMNLGIYIKKKSDK